ncbi:ABC transporter ATP-binding protein [Mucilaginibacter sp. UYCu711]|uniref:ABC transporter ATP-binding protein n=1 Tax=Mucilaginibacter sp. UYCu711 TaxID=3156339 RepID=UPI003D1C1667
MEINIKRTVKLLSEIKLMRTLRLIWSLTPVATSITLVMIAVENGLFLLTAYLFKNLFNIIVHNTVFAPPALALINKYLIELFIVILLYVIAKSVSDYVNRLQAAKVGEYIDDKIHASAVSLDLAFYESPAYFDTLKRAKDAGLEGPNAVVMALANVVKTGIMFCTLSYVIITINWLLLPILTLCIIPTFFVKIKLAEKLHDLRIAHTPMERKATYISSLITGDSLAKEVKGFGLGGYLKELYLSIRLELMSQRLLIVRKSTFYDIITSILASIGFFSCIIFFCYSAIKGKISVDNISLFIVVFPQLFNILQTLSQGLTGLYQNSIFLTQLFKVFDLNPLLVDNPNPIEIPEDSSAILTVEDVSFTYPNSSERVLHKMNLEIHPGKVVAVVGLNGAGKTTLIKLLCRLYDPTFGQIKIGNIDVRRFKTDDFRKKVSVVFQDFGRYNFSVADNIRFGDISGDRSEKDIVNAATASGANNYIDEFPEGYKTIMGRIFEDGREVSIGQWQKLAIARALFSPSKFIVLDEATSALDALSEYDFFKMFRKNIGNRGALIISHRVSAVKHADYIYVMANGEVVQCGTHQQLIAMEGNYAALFSDKEEKSNEQQPM